MPLSSLRRISHSASLRASGSFSADYDEFNSYASLRIHRTATGESRDPNMARFDPKSGEVYLKMDGQTSTVFLEGNDFHDVGDTDGGSFTVELSGVRQGRTFTGTCQVGGVLGDTWEWSASR